MKTPNTTRKTLDDYVENNGLNSEIYLILLHLEDGKTHCRSKLKQTPLEIFNQAYAICDEVKKEKHPEHIALDLWDKIYPRLLMCETSIVFACAYVILLFSEIKNPNIKYFLARIRQKIDTALFREFMPIVKKELVRITAVMDSFEMLEREGGKIADLAEREIFYIDVWRRCKRAKAKVDTLQQIHDEIDFIKQMKAVYPVAKHTENPVKTTEEEADAVSTKIRAVVIMELLQKLELGRAYNDLTKICKLISLLTGASYNNIRNQIHKGIHFSEYHHKEIEETNKILKDLNTSITIDMNKEY